MLPSNYRLRRRGDFTTTVRSGVRVRRDGVVAHVAHRSHQDPVPRCGFVVPGAVGTAVVRNKVRRRLRHLLMARLHDLPAGCDVVIRVDRGAADLSFDELGGYLAAALNAAATRLQAVRSNGEHTGGETMTPGRAR